MEPIRPDDDELRADTARAHATAETRSHAARRSGKAVERARPEASGKSSSGRAVGLMFALLLVSIAAGAIGWYQQSQRIGAMQSQLEEADYWARQSKLALARFQGDLSATGENLEQRGSGLEQNIKEQKAAIADANSEIRKLWVIANEKNRPAIADQGKKLDELAKTQASQASAIKELSDQGATIEGQVSDLTDQLAGVKTQLATLDKTVGSLSSQVAELGKDVGSVDDKIAQKLQRFEREQALAADGLEGRVSKLENGVGVAHQNAARLDRMEETLNAVDAARSQLTSRLIQLSRRVDALQKQ